MVECARVAVVHDARLGEFYERVKRRRGEQKALVAVAAKMLKIIWFMLTAGSPINLGIQGFMGKSLRGFRGIRAVCWLWVCCWLGRKSLS